MPPHEIVKVAVRLDDVSTGPQPEVKGVTKNDLGADLGDVPRQHAFDRAVGANRHKRGGFHHTSRKVDLTASGQSILVGYVKLHQALRSLVRNMASP